jgi:hypothetical protein
MPVPSLVHYSIILSCLVIWVVILRNFISVGWNLLQLLFDESQALVPYDNTSKTWAQSKPVACDYGSCAITVWFLDGGFEGEIE